MDTNEVLMAMEYVAFNSEEIWGFLVDLTDAPQFSVVSNMH